MTVIDRVPVGDITAEARAVPLGKMLLTLIAAILFGVGWVVAKVFMGAGFVLAWCAAAIKLGWRQARGSG